MTLRMIGIRYAVVCFIAALAFSCSETPEPTPTPNPPAKEDPDDDEGPVIAYAQIEGKWLIGEVSFANGTNARIKTLGRNRIESKLFKNQNLFSPNGRIAEESPQEAFLEFLADSSYILFDGYMGFYRGKVSVGNENSLVLKGFGTIENFVFSEGRFAFELISESTGNNIPVEATKAELYELDQRTKLLCRDWIPQEVYTGNEDDGIVEYGVEVSLEYFDGTIVTGILESGGYLYTTSGTYFVYAIVDGQAHILESSVWEWLSDTHIQYRDWSNVDRIEELTEERLVLVDEEELNGVLYEYRRIILKSAPPYFED